MKTVKQETGWFLIDQHTQRGPFPTRDAARAVLKMLRLSEKPQESEDKARENLSF